MKNQFQGKFGQSEIRPYKCVPPPMLLMQAGPAQPNLDLMASFSKQLIVTAIASFVIAKTAPIF